MTSIGSHAFSWCTSLTNVDLTNSVSNISYTAFSGCSNLKYNNFDNGLYLGNETNPYVALINAKSKDLTSCEIFNNCVTIADRAFLGCTGLTSIDIPNSVTSIGALAFSGCRSLTSVSISNNIRYIGDRAFDSQATNQYENGLYLGNDENPYIALYVVLPTEADYFIIHKDCKYINKEQQYGLYITLVQNLSIESKRKIFNFSSVILNENNQFPLRKKLIIYDNCQKEGDYIISNMNDKKYLCRYDGSETDLVLPAVDGIGYAVFLGSNLNNVLIADNTTEIFEKAFYDCNNLTHIVVPQNIASIGTNAFYGCTSLKKVYNCSSLPIYQGNGNGCIALYANYVYNYCQKNGDFILTTPYDKKYVCGYLGKETHLVFPQADGIYPNAFRDCQSITEVTLSDNMTEIGNYAFYNCKKLTNISISDRLTHIGDYAFYGCTGLTQLCLPNSLTLIGNHAFYGCTGLTQLRLPNSLTLIGDHAFYGCTGLKSANFPNSLTDINPHAFAECTKLENVILQNGLKAIGDSAFYGCTGATKFSIPQSVTSIGIQAFGNCSGSLTLHCDTDGATDYTGSCFYNANFSELIIGHEVEKIGNYEFYDMKSLQKIHIGSKVDRIGYNAFGNCTGLKGIYINALTPPRCRNSLVFHDDTKWDCTLYVPGPSINDYKSADVWKEFMSIKEYEGYSNSIEEIEQDALSAPKRNLLGQKLSAPIKGKVYLQNGKKFLME